MATRPAIKTGPDNQGRIRVTWEGLLQGDDGSPVEISQFPDKSVHSDGSYTSTGAIAMQGSNTGTAWFALTKPGGAEISLTADTVGAMIVENPRFIRPLVTDGDGSTDIDVLLEAYVPRG